MNHYFVSYLFQNAHGLAAGNCELSCPKPISSMQDVNDIAEYLRKQGLVNAVVLSFCPFDGAAAAGGATR
jgi:hypothetical protein